MNSVVIMLKSLIEHAKAFYNEAKTKENARYLSWEHCYDKFGIAFEKPDVSSDHIDYLCLHLAFYLASWGMYRGSSFLLQKDYKVHKKAVDEILKYPSLRGISCRDLLEPANMDMLFELADKLRSIYTGIRNGVKECTADLSNILVTKILMGTLGCTPAYDEYFKAGIKKYEVQTGINLIQSFSPKSLSNLARFYDSNSSVFDPILKTMTTESKLPYPEMKFIDMAFWEIGKASKVTG